MSDTVKLKKVTADNWEAVVELELGAGQEDLVASNLYSVAEAQFYHDERPHAGNAGKRVVVGFLMYDVQKTNGKVQEASIYHFMIDRKARQWLWSRGAEQGSGGDSSDPGGERDIDPLHARKSGSKAVLHQIGLSGGGWDRDGEVIAVLKL